MQCENLQQSANVYDVNIYTERIILQLDMDIDHIITYPMIYFGIAVFPGLTKILPIEKCIIFLDTVIEQNFVFHIYGGHFEYFKLLKGGNIPPTWKYSLGPYRWIIKREKYCIVQFYHDPYRCQTNQ